jgi:hypothetical protein
LLESTEASGTDEKGVRRSEVPAKTGGANKQQGAGMDLNQSIIIIGKFAS